MAMDFFARQDQAHALTRRLVVLFIVAVVAIVVALNVVTWGVMEWQASEYHNQGISARGTSVSVHVAVTVGTLAIIVIGSFWKIVELRAGGTAVAAMVGAHPLNRTGGDAGEQRFVNVVEEMSIASGVAMPQLYLMEDSGINAFAAGYGPSDTVIAVTRGCLERLSRDELQGVIAHEFSHILNGDMRLNMRLIGIVHGILVISLIGEFILRIGSRSGGSSSSRKGNNGGAILLIGFAMLIIGYIGYFFGQLIKAAISRQREFLADASAVQFTRNPEGIGGALKKIGGNYELSYIQSHRANECSHLFLGRAVAGSWLSGLDTHPPLDERIRAIDPHWDGVWTASGPALRRDTRSSRPTAPPLQNVGALTAVIASSMGQSSGKITPMREFAQPGTGEIAAAPGMAPDFLIPRVGVIAPDTIAFGAGLLSSLPDSLMQASRDPFTARAVVLAILIGDSRAKNLPLMDMLDRMDPALYREIRRLLPEITQVGEGARLPLIDLSLPTLLGCVPAQQKAFIAVFDLVMRSREEMPLSLVILAGLVRRRLTMVPSSRSVSSVTVLSPHLEVVLTALAHVGQRDDAARHKAFVSGSERIALARGSLRMLPDAEISPMRLFSALDQLAQANGSLARQILSACAWCVASDGIVTIHEAELLRAVSMYLDCPMPPFADMTTQQLQTV